MKLIGTTFEYDGFIYNILSRRGDLYVLDTVDTKNAAHGVMTIYVTYRKLRMLMGRD